jgi:hypothetical protein
MDEATKDQKIKVLDSVHDYKAEEEPVPQILSDIITSQYLPTVTKQLSLKDCVAEFTNNSIKNVTADYERRAESYLEDILPLQKLSPDDVLTYQQIINDSNNGQTLWTKYKNLNGVVDIIKIQPGAGESFAELAGKKNENKDTKQKLQLILGNFILAFLFPDTDPGQQMPRITFDANSGVLGKIFGDMEQVKCIITPLNIGDSASTSTDSLNGRVECIFPGLDLNNPLKYDVQSNLFTKDEYKLSYNNTGFSKNDMFNFNLTINDGTTDVIIPFSEDQNQGPSKHYLSELIVALEEDESTDIAGNTKNVLRLGSYLPRLAGGKREKQKLLFDIKRTGDYEQVDGGVNIKQKYYRHMMISTRDVLCAVYARKKKLACIFHYDEDIYIYRFTTGEMTIDGVLFKMMNDIVNIEYIVSKFIFINGAGKATFMDNITLQIGLFDMLKNNGCFVSKNKLTEDLPAYIFITLLLRLKMFDMHTQLSQIMTFIGPLLNFMGSFINSPPNNEAGVPQPSKLQILQYFVECYNDSTKRAQIDVSSQDDIKVTKDGRPYSVSQLINEFNENYDHGLFIEQVSKLIEKPSQLKILTTPIDATSPFEYTFLKDLSTGETNLFAKKDLTVFDYKYDFFMNLYSAYSELLKELTKVMTNKGLSRRAPFTISKLCTAFIENLQYIEDSIFFPDLKEILNIVLKEIKIDFEKLDDAFSNQKTDLIAELLENIYKKLQTGLNEQMVGIARNFYVNPDMKQCITQPAADRQPPAADMETFGGGKKFIQTGGSAESEVYFDMNDVFREICGLAEATINSQYSRLYPHYNIHNLISNAILELKEDAPTGNISAETANITETAIANLIVYYSTYGADPTQAGIIQHLGNSGVNNPATNTPYSIPDYLYVLFVSKNYGGGLLVLTQILPLFTTLPVGDLREFIGFLERKNAEIEPIYNSIAATWKVGLENVKNIDAYVFNPGLFLISFLLSYQPDGSFDPIDDGCQNSYDDVMLLLEKKNPSPQFDRRFLDFLLQLNNFMRQGLYPPALNLLILTIFNTIMNHKYSYINLLNPSGFVFPTIKYDSKDEWDNLVIQLTEIKTFLNSFFFTPAQLSRGGKTRRKSKKNRKINKKGKTNKKPHAVKINKTVKKRLAKKRRNKTVKNIA